MAEKTIGKKEKKTIIRTAKTSCRARLKGPVKSKEKVAEKTREITNA